MTTRSVRSRLRRAGGAAAGVVVRDARTTCASKVSRSSLCAAAFCTSLQTMRYAAKATTTSAERDQQLGTGPDQYPQNRAHLPPSGYSLEYIIDNIV